MYSLKTKAEVFKTPRCRLRAQKLARRLLGQEPILEVYRSTEKKKHVDQTKVVKLVQPGQALSTAEPWYWTDNSWQQLWMAIDGFSVEKRVKEEFNTRPKRVFVEEHEELPVYTSDNHRTSSYGCEKQGYFAITMAGYGVVVAVAMRTATRLSNTKRDPPRNRFKYWHDMLVQLGIGDHATEEMMRSKVWKV